MIELKKYNGKMLASAKDIYDLLNVKRQFSTWILTSLKNAWLKYEVDYETHVHVRKSDNQAVAGRRFTDYLLTEQAALNIIVMSRVQNAQNVRNQIIKAFQQKQTGVLLNVDQVSALTDMVKAMTLVSAQKESERKHYDFLNRPKDWYSYRAELLGYSAKSLKSAMIEVNKKYKNQKQALIHLDPAEIIRTGVVDLLIALGRGREYALNIAEFAKVIAEKNNYHLEIWNDTEPNPLKINESQINDRKKLY